MSFVDIQPNTLIVVAVLSLLGLACMVAIWSFVAKKKLERLYGLAESDRERLSAQILDVKDAMREELHHKDVLIAKLEEVADQKAFQADQYKKDIAVLSQVKEEFIQLQAKFAEKEVQLKSQEALLSETKTALLKEFELSANKLFESKQHSFNQTSRQNMETVLNPFKQQLSEFNKQVESVYHKENTQRNQLIGQIGELQKQAQRISEDANNLASALKGDNKVQGQWGEIILERLLEQSGLVKGREYQTQINYKNEAGKNFRPDVIVHLPDQKDIVIDAKVALVEYERFASEEDDSLKPALLKGHVDAIRTHIKALSVKNYEQLEGIRTLDFVFMFVPIEAAYVAAVQSAPALFKEAHDKNIMLVSPSSLMVALRTVETMWRFEKQNVNAEKIAASAGKLYDQFALVMASLEELEGYINKAGRSYEKAFKQLANGKGNVLKRIDDLKKLGAKTSRALPKATQESLEQQKDVQIELLANEEDS